jgi:hypothetical protein
MDTQRGSSVKPVLDDLQRVFGDRLEALVVYGWRPRGPVPTLAVGRRPQRLCRAHGRVASGRGGDAVAAHAGGFRAIP